MSRKRQPPDGIVTTVSRSPAHSIRKANDDVIRLVVRPGVMLEDRSDEPEARAKDFISFARASGLNRYTIIVEEAGGSGSGTPVAPRHLESAVRDRGAIVMTEVLLVVAALVVWFILFSWVLPKLGVKT